MPIFHITIQASKIVECVYKLDAANREEAIERFNNNEGELIGEDTLDYEESFDHIEEL